MNLFRSLPYGFLRLFVPFTLCMLACCLTAGQVTTGNFEYAKEVERLTEKFQARLYAARYMERDECTTTTYPGWEGFPLRLCHYSVKDKDGVVKPGKIIMLNPSATQIARWVTSAVVETTGSISPTDGDKLYNHVICQSGGQFPVAGIVYEDMDGSGIHKIYCFRNGVTVHIEGVPHASGIAPTHEQLDLALSGRVTRVRRYARIQSTSPSEYRAAGGTVDVGTDTTPTLAWLDVVKQSYQAAWDQDSNQLMTALSNSKLSKLPPLKDNNRCW